MLPESAALLNGMGTGMVVRFQRWCSWRMRCEFEEWCRVFPVSGSIVFCQAVEMPSRWLKHAQDHHDHDALVQKTSGAERMEMSSPMLRVEHQGTALRVLCTRRPFIRTKAYVLVNETQSWGLKGGYFLIDSWTLLIWHVHIVLFSVEWQTF